MAIALSVQDPQGNQILYNAHEQVSIGRDPSQATVVLDNEFVSRLHCVIQRRHNGQWVVIHRGRNPSRLDDQDLRRPGEQAILRERSALTVGGVRIELVVDDDPPTELIDIAGVLDVPEFEPAWVGGEDEDDSEHTLLEVENPFAIGPDEDDDNDLPWQESRTVVTGAVWNRPAGSSSDGWDDRPIPSGGHKEHNSDGRWREHSVAGRLERLPVKETIPLVIDVARSELVALQSDEGMEDDETSLEVQNPGADQVEAESPIASAPSAPVAQVVASAPAGDSSPAAGLAEPVSVVAPSGRRSIPADLRVTASMRANPAAFDSSATAPAGARAAVSAATSLPATAPAPVNADSSVATTSPVSQASPVATTTPMVAPSPIATTSPIVATSPIATTTPIVATSPNVTTSPIATTSPNVATSPNVPTSPIVAASGGVAPSTIAPGSAVASNPLKAGIDGTSPLVTQAPLPSGAFTSPVLRHRQSWIGAFFAWLTRLFSPRRP